MTEVYPYNAQQQINKDTKQTKIVQKSKVNQHPSSVPQNQGNKEASIYQQRVIIYPTVPEYRQMVPPPPPRIIVIEQIPRISTISHCPICGHDTDSYQTYRDGTFVWLMCLLLFLFTFCLFWIAFLVDEWKDLQFRCARCHHVKFVRKGGC